jgi:hypothetical protein
MPISFVKLLPTKLTTVISSPKGPQKRRSWGHLMSMVNRSGDTRYMTPVCEVPMDAMAEGEAAGRCVV